MLTKAALCAALLLSLFVVASAQEKKDAAPVSRKSQIYLDVVVSSKSGAPVGDLEQSDFTLLDNNVPQTLTSFKTVNGRQAPISVIFVLDAVNAAFRDMSTQRTEVEKFLRSEGGHLAYPTGVVLVTAQGPQIVADFSVDGNALVATLESPNSPLRSMARMAGLNRADERWELSVKSLRQLVAGVSGHPGCTAMVWISPGWMVQNVVNDRPTADQQHSLFSNLEELSNSMLQSRIALYSIDPRGAGESVLRAEAYQDYLKGAPSSDRITMGHLALPVLAVESGGQAFYSSNDVSGQIQDIVAHAAPFYEISYEPELTARANEYHRLEVRIGKPGLIARTHQAYYANPSVKK